MYRRRELRLDAVPLIDCTDRQARTGLLTRIVVGGDRMSLEE